jgi:hypothetical protein
MKEIILDKKVIEMADNLEKGIKEYQRNISMIYQTVIAQSGFECTFKLSPDKTKLIEAEDDKKVPE